MNFKINLNGTSFDELARQQTKLREGLDTFRSALRNAWPHGRDYQTVDHPRDKCRLDAMRFEAAMEKLQKIENDLIEPRMQRLIDEQKR